MTLGQNSKLSNSVRRVGRRSLPITLKPPSANGINSITLSITGSPRRSRTAQYVSLLPRLGVLDVDGTDS